LIPDEDAADVAHLATLQEQCDTLAVQAARVGASIYANSDKIAQIAREALEHAEQDPLEVLSLEMLKALRVAEKHLIDSGNFKAADELQLQAFEKRLQRLNISTSSLG